MHTTNQSLLDSWDTLLSAARPDKTHDIKACFSSLLLRLEADLSEFRKLPRRDLNNLQILGAASNCLKVIDGLIVQQRLKEYDSKTLRLADEAFLLIGQAFRLAGLDNPQQEIDDRDFKIAALELLRSYGIDTGIEDPLSFYRTRERLVSSPAQQTPHK